MNFNQLKYIIAVDHQRNFSRAAEECGIAQSTLSKEVQRLEQEFDIMIFDRSRQPVTPTLKGKDILKQAQNILDEKDRFIAIALQKQNQPIGNFRLGILPTLAPYLLPLFIRPLAEKYPELHVEILELTSQEMISQFEDNELDGAIAITPFIKDGFYESHLFEEDFVLYISPDHPLAKQKQVSWADIPLNELLLHEAFQGYLLSSDEIKKHTGLTSKNLHNFNYQSGSLETIRKIIDRSGGLTLLPHLASTYMGERRLKMVRPIVNPTLKRTVAFITPRGFEKTRITKVLKREILAGLPEE